MKYTLAFLGALCAFLIVVGCSGSAGEEQITINNPKKCPLKIALYLPDSITHGQIQVTASGGCKDANVLKVDESKSYRYAIANGLATAFTSVTVLPVKPTPQQMRGKYDALAVASISNSSAAADIKEEELITTYIHCQYQTSVSLNFTDPYGDSLYSFKADGSGASNEKGPCSAFNSVFQVAVDTALSQVSSFIARSSYSSPQLTAYAQKVK